MSTIINPNATIALAAELPSQPGQAAHYQVPLDPSVQGMPRLNPSDLGIIVWILTTNMVAALRRIDRLERLMVDAAGRTPPEAALETHGLQVALVTEVTARREAEAKAREHEAAKEGAH